MLKLQECKQVSVVRGWYGLEKYILWYILLQKAIKNKKIIILDISI